MDARGCPGWVVIYPTLKLYKSVPKTPIIDSYNIVNDIQTFRQKTLAKWQQCHPCFSDFS